MGHLVWVGQIKITCLVKMTNVFEVNLDIFIDVYLIGVSNLKGCVHSLPHNHFYLKQYEELSCFSSCLFIFIYLFILARAMSESALKRLR
jgi:hypothetical protein